MSETKVPAIPPSSSEKFSDAVKELIEVREGLRGDPLDQNITLRQLQDAGIVSATITGKRNNGGRPIVTLNPFTEPGDMAVPPAIQNLIVSGGYQQMFLEWDQPNYGNRAYVEIWRSDVDLLGGAIQVGQTPAMVYTDPCGSGRTYYYWVRAVSTTGVVGPFNTVNGTVGSTSPDVSFLLGVLNGELTSSQLHSSLGTRIDLIDTDSLVNSVGARITAARGDLQGRISVVNDRVTTVSEDLISRIDEIILLGAAGDGDAALISAEQTARITADGVLASDILTLAAQTQDDIIAAIQLEATARADGDSAATSIAQTAVSRVGSVESALATNYYTRSDTNSAIAASTTTLSSTVAGHTASINILFNTTNGLYTEYTVRASVESDGVTRVSGFGLSARPGLSTFEVRTDVFAISAPAGVDTEPSSTKPFYHRSTPSTIVVEGVSVNVPAGTYIDAAFIRNASIESAKIGTLSADKITSGSIATDRLKANVIAATNLSADFILAARIDTKNLNVKDPDGNILLSSTKLPPSFHATGYRWEFDPLVPYGGDGLVGPWTGASGVTVTDRDNFLELNFTLFASGGPFSVGSPFLIGPDLPRDIFGKKHNVVRMRLKLFSGSSTGWAGNMFFTTYGATVTGSASAAPVPVGNGWVELDWDMTDVGNWTNGEIKNITFSLMSPQALAVSVNKPVFYIDYIAIGSHSTGMLIDSANVSTFIQAGVITNAFIGDTISSIDYDGSPEYNQAVSEFDDPGEAGWVINKRGDAVFHNGYFRGDIRANSVTAGVLDATTITGATIFGGTVEGGEILIGTGGQKFRDKQASDAGVQEPWPILKSTVVASHNGSFSATGGTRQTLTGLTQTSCYIGGKVSTEAVNYLVTVSAVVNNYLYLSVDNVLVATSLEPQNDYGSVTVTYAGTATLGTSGSITFQVSTDTLDGKTDIRTINASLIVVNF